MAFFTSYILIPKGLGGPLLITKIYQTSSDIFVWNPRNGKNATLILVYNINFLWTVKHVKITTPIKCLEELPCAIGGRSLPFGTINPQKVLWCFGLVALLPLLNCYTQSSIHFCPSEGFKIYPYNLFKINPKFLWPCLVGEVSNPAE